MAVDAIQSTHQNLHACYASKTDPPLLELADMILLLSAQMTLAAGAPANRNLAPVDREAEGRSKYSTH